MLVERLFHSPIHLMIFYVIICSFVNTLVMLPACWLAALIYNWKDLSSEFILIITFYSILFSLLFFSIFLCINAMANFASSTYFQNWCTSSSSASSNWKSNLIRCVLNAINTPVCRNYSLSLNLVSGGFRNFCGVKFSGSNISFWVENKLS